jgi:hypothetical protein
MSYARWLANESDVYVFASCSGGIECCGCFLNGVSGSPNFPTSGEVIAHLNEHRAAGDLVADDTYEQILADYPDVNAVITAND